MDLKIDCIVVNGTNYIPERKFIEITEETVKHDLPLVNLDKVEKQRERNRDYYKKNKAKWVKYNESKKQNNQLMKDLRTVLAFH